MPLIEWREEFRTGIASVDHEHEGLIGLINELHGHVPAADKGDKVAEFLGEIHARIAAHFALEEKVMREHRYDQYADHKADHEALLDEIRDIMDGYEDGAFAQCEPILAERLRTWFVRHFQTKDVRLHRLLGSASRS
jgi:hemerythrin